MSVRTRIVVTALSLSSAAFVGLTTDEGYTGAAVIPTKGDVPTLGFGSTTHADGRPVRMGDTTTPPKALARTLAYIQVDEAALKRCVKAPLNQPEYDTLVNFSYQYGIGATCSSRIVALINAGDYPGSCEAYTDYRFMTSGKPIPGWEQYKPGRWRFDCSTPGNRQCMGVWTRSASRRDACRAAQS